MSVDFYGPFDREYLRNESNPARTQDYRGVFHQDRDRLMFTSSFRRLQAKTQVFRAGEYDFYRTRLTHSLDVASVAESIGVWLTSRHPEVSVDAHLLQAICLAHDIGHPPFGHAGERVINKLMAAYGGFEGNAQTLRILTRTIYSNPGGRGGMSPSRALLDGVLKYKRLYRDRGEDMNHFIYDDQAGLLEFCFGESDLAARFRGEDINAFRSLECQIMDLADDIAYSCFDIVDGANARFLTPERLQSWGASGQAKLDNPQRTHLEDLVSMMMEGRLESRMSRIVGELIQSSSLAPRSGFMSDRTRRHAYDVVIEPLAQSRIQLHKVLSRELVFGSSELQQIEFKGGRILGQLSQTLLGNYLDGAARPAVLVPNDVHRVILASDNAAERARLVCDYISGMTDAYALRSYKRLLDPDYGSISELI
jgi:dGTPase